MLITYGLRKGCQWARGSMCILSKTSVSKCCVSFGCRLNHLLWSKPAKACFM